MPFRDAFPQDHALQLRDLILDMTAHSVLAGHSKVILRKLFVAVSLLLLLGDFLEKLTVHDAAHILGAETCPDASTSMARLDTHVRYSPLWPRCVDGAPVGFPLDRRGRGGNFRSVSEQQVSERELWSARLA